MSPSVLQHASGTVTLTSGTTGTLTASFAANITPGSTIVACITVRESSLGTPSITSVKTGTLAENWALPAGASDTASGGGSLLAAIWVNPNSGGGSKVINVALSFSSTMSGSNEGTAGLDIYEVAQVANTSPADKVKIASQSGVTSWSSGASATTAQASEIAFGVAGFTNTNIAMTATGPGSPWTNEAMLGTIGAGHYQLSGFNVLSATGTVTYSGTNSASAGVATVVVTLLAGASATGTGAVTVPKPSLAGAGSVGNSGTGAVTVPKPSLAGAGTFDSTVTGTGSVRVPKPSLAGTGAVEVTGTGSVTVPKPSLAGLGWLTVTGTGSVTVPKPSLAGAGRSGSQSRAAGFLAFFS